MDHQLFLSCKSLLIKHEGNKNLPYLDTENKITIGVGRNLTDCGIRDDEKDLMIKNDIEFFYDFLSNNYDWFNDLSDIRKICLIDFCFVGCKKFQSFKKMITALEKKDYEKASEELLNSKYAQQVGQRAIDISNILLFDKL